MSLKELTEILTEQFALTSKNDEIDSESAYLKYLQAKLAAKIEFLINSNLEKLFQILYLIDVPQKYSDEAFELGEVKKISMKLSELIIQRQLDKINYARKFKGDL